MQPGVVQLGGLSRSNTSTSSTVFLHHGQQSSCEREKTQTKQNHELCGRSKLCPVDVANGGAISTWPPPLNRRRGEGRRRGAWRLCGVRVAGNLLSVLACHNTAVSTSGDALNICKHSQMFGCPAPGGVEMKPGGALMLTDIKTGKNTLEIIPLAIVWVAV